MTVASVVVGACAGGALLAAASGAATSGGRTVPVTERDFRITAPKRIAAGAVSLDVTNNGPDTHELIVVRTNGKPLPLRSDGLTVDEDRLERRIVGVIEPKGPRTTHKLRLRLPPGRYVLLCNMAGHYLGGMHTLLVVH